MAAFLLLMFVFASQVIGGFNTKLPPPAYGSTITILNIDGGGIKGILPTVVLEHLEKALQNVTKDENAALADYFDVISGASTGGLIAAMLAAPHPNDPSRPALYTPEILKFYLDFGPSIFNQTSARWWFNLSERPKYDGKFLHDKAREILQETRLHDTLTNVVIPTYDIKKVKPFVFSSFKVEKVPDLDAKLSDIAIGTSAAPTLLPPYGFKNGDIEFNLVDGALVASSPALLAVSEVIKLLEEKNSDFISVNENQPTKILLLSLGCGRDGEDKGVNATYATSFRALIEWPQLILPAIAGAVGDINEYHLESIFPSHRSSDNYYLRIEEYNLDPSIGGDDTTKENLDKLVKAGEDLLEETVKVMDVTSFVPYEKPTEGTNAQALERLAETLYKEKQLRLKTKSMEKIKSMEKMGRPFVEAVVSGMK
ncbi:patatin-like phospholipase [Medicago truncatula]|uniref:Patatin n=1 Tax=Medicago truncatula TaxID=3880 RepID=A0A072TWJ7_MEDTR|nr:patatin-like phospholipase [Medicago truncatula]